MIYYHLLKFFPLRKFVFLIDTLLLLLAVVVVVLFFWQRDFLARYEFLAVSNQVQQKSTDLNMAIRQIFSFSTRDKVCLINAANS